MLLGAVNALFFSLNISAMIIADPISHLWVLSLIGIIQTICILIATRQYNPFNLFTMIMILWSVQFSMVALLSLYFDIPFRHNIDETYLGKAVFLNNICQLLFVTVWKMPLWTKLATKAPRLSFPQLNEAKDAIMYMWFISVLVRGILIFKGYQPGFDVEGGALDVVTNIIQIVSSFLEMMPLLFFCSLLSTNNNKNLRFSLYIVLIEIILNFFSGSKAGPIILLVNFLVAYHYIYKPISTKKAITYIIIAFIALFPFYAVKSAVRETLNIKYGLLENTDERPILSLNNYFELYSEALNRIDTDNLADNLNATANALVYRFETLTTAAGTLSYYDHGHSHDLGEYLLLWVKPYIPRFFWEDKGWVGLGLFISNEIMEIPHYTHSTPTSAIEGYIAAGLVGAIILTMIHAVFVKFTYMYMVYQNNSQRNTLPRAYFMANYLTVLFFVQSYTFIRSMFLNLLVLWFVFRLLPTQRKAKSRMTE